MDRPPPYTIAVLNQKGGTGKTTLATNLAAAVHLSGHKTLMLDLDRQGTALDWSSGYPDKSPLEGLAVSKHDKALQPAALRSLARGQDVVVLDGPPFLGDVLQNAALLADTVLVPCQPSGFDYWALIDTVKMLLQADQLRQAAGMRPSRRFFVVWRTKPRSGMSAAFPDTLRKGFGEVSEVMPVFVGDRDAYRKASTSHDSVLTAEPKGPAAGEIRTIHRLLQEAECLP